MLGLAISMASKKRRRASSPPERGDTTPERLARAGTDTYRDTTGRRQVHDNTLCRALRRGSISEDQFQAGLKYCELQYLSGLDGSVSAIDLNRVMGRQIANFDRLSTTERLAESRSDYANANKTLGKLGEATVTYLVCNSGSLEKWGIVMGYGNRTAAIAAAEASLKIFLTMLCR